MKESRPLPKRRAIAEDVAIGVKPRALRRDRGLSQGDLGRVVGVTFQQLQKYEKGVNRISAGRLARIAVALGVPVTAFYEAAARRKSDQRFAYLNSAGAVHNRRFCLWCAVVACRTGCRRCRLGMGTSEEPGLAHPLIGLSDADLRGMTDSKIARAR